MKTADTAKDRDIALALQGAETMARGERAAIKRRLRRRQRHAETQVVAAQQAEGGRDDLE